MYSNDSADEGDDDLAPPTMVPRAELQPGSIMAKRDMEDEEDNYDELSLRHNRSHQAYLEMQRRALEQYEQKLEQDFRGEDDDEEYEVEHGDVEDLSLPSSTEPPAKKLRTGSNGNGTGDEGEESDHKHQQQNSSGNDDIKKEESWNTMNDSFKWFFL